MISGVYGLKVVLILYYHDSYEITYALMQNRNCLASEIDVIIIYTNTHYPAAFR